MSYLSQELFDIIWAMVQEKPERATKGYCPSCQREAACVKPKWLRAAAWRMRRELSSQWNRACLECGWVSIHTAVKNKKLRAAVYDADNHECVYCGNQERIGLDHIVPQTHGGGHTFDNLLTCCHWCNSIKKDRRGVIPQYGRYRNA